jgi:glycosyltransferase involved in cell wall biosynthesis
VSSCTLHLLGLFHTQESEAFDHCAFTGKVRRFPRMMQALGWRVCLYSNEGSDAGASEHVPMLTQAEFAELYGSREATAFHGDHATIGSAGHAAFEAKLIPALRARVQPGDLILHPFGHAHQRVVAEFPDQLHVESGIGYPTLLDGTFRVFESYAWMHYHQGKADRWGANYDWVAPNYYDPQDWPEGPGGDYLAFLGRICTEKGLDVIRAIADHSPLPIVLCGQGDASRWQHPMIRYAGPIVGRERARFLGGARAALMPTQFVEPFGGSGVEALLCGTPLIASDWGAFTETVQPGVNGFRPRTLQGWLDAIDEAQALDRSAIAAAARARYSLAAVGEQYDRIFRDLLNLRGAGWYTLRDQAPEQIDYDRIEAEEGPFAQRLAQWIAETICPATALDVGCGPGTYVRALRAYGVCAEGIDSDPRVAGIDHVHQRSLLDGPRLESELVLCLEVAEHIEPDLGPAVAAAVAGAVAPGGLLIWTAAAPGQGGSGHINCQPREHWLALLEAQGLAHCPAAEEGLRAFARNGYHLGWFPQNLIVLRRRED